MKCKTLALFFLFLTLVLCVVSQDDAVALKVHKRTPALTQKVDSLKGLTFTDVDKKVENLQQISGLYREFNLDSALAYARKELHLATERGGFNQVAEARINVSSILHLLDQREASKLLLLKNRRDRENINDTLLAYTEAMLSNVFIITEEYDLSVLAGLAAAQAFERLRDSSNAGFTYISLAEIHALVLDDPAEGIKYIKKAIRFLHAKGASKEYLVAALLSYGEISVVYEDYDTALLNFQKAERVAVENEVFWYVPDILNGFGKVYYYRGEHEKSITYLKQAIDRAAEANDSWKMVRGYEMLGLNYKDLKEAEHAIACFKQCIQHELTAEGRNRCKGYLVECYEQVSDFKKAFELQQEIMVSRDSIAASKQKEKLTAIIEAYENEKKQLKIEQLRKANIQKENYIDLQHYAMWGILFFFILIGVGGYSWLRTRQKLKDGIGKMENAQLRQRFLRTQLNPHFFFHALSSIEGYIYANEKKNAAGFLRNFSKLMRNILETSDQDFVSLEEDVSMIREYLTLQRLNNDFKFDYTIHVAEELDLAHWKIPPMLIQPFVENAILHGALNAEDGMVALHYSLVDEQLQIKIEDNGPSDASASRKSGALHRSMSTDITKHRINNLQEMYGISIHYSFEARKGGIEGTTVTFQVPFIAVG